ncbi:MAG: helix-turn-helix domain-containing protein [Candidatus Kapaibacteriales bacterium]
MEKIPDILRKIREGKKLSYTDIYKATNIHPKILQAIEDGNYTLQPPIYMKSFIKEYLEFLGLNPADYRQQINEIFWQLEKDLSSVKNKTSTLSSKKIKKIRTTYQQMNKAIYFVYATLFLGILLIIYFTFFHTGEETNILQETTLKPETLFIGQNKNLSIQPPSVQNDSITLELKAIDTVWLNAIIDNIYSDKLILYPGNVKQLRAMNFFRLTIGNAGGIVIKRNGIELPPLGKRGTVVKSITITREQVLFGPLPKIAQSPHKKSDSLAKILQPTMPSRIQPSLRDTKLLIPKR